MDMTTVIILRSLERILAVAAGSLFAWLGYQLFLKVPTKETSEGKFNLPGGTAIHLTRVGPGIFFSLFGASIVALSFLKPVNYTDGLAATETGKNSNAFAKSENSARGASYSGVGPGSSLNRDRLSLDTLLNQASLDIIALNTALSALEANQELKPEQRADLRTAGPRIKLAIMKKVWDPETWGDFDAFEDWVNTGVGTPPLHLNRKALAYYSAK